MKHFVLMVVMLLMAAGSLFAQGMGGGGFMMGGNSDTQMAHTEKGLFVLRAGVLAKYDAATLKQLQTVQLFGPAPEMPKDGADRAALQKYQQDIQRRRAPAIMLAKDNSLLLVIGDGFARVNQDTLKIEVPVDLRNPAEQPAAPEGSRGFQAEPAPEYLLVDNVLYLMRSKELLAISITDGKVTRAALSKELQATLWNPQGGQRGNFGGQRGGNDGGQRGGNRDGNRTAPPQ